MRKIDNYLLDFFQKTYDALHYWTGKNCFFFSRVFLVLATVTLIAGNCIVKIYSVAFVNALFGIILFFIYKKEERDYKQEMANVCKIKYYIARIIILFLIILNLVTFYRLYALGNAMMNASLYFLACEINPKAKVFEWKKSLTFTLKPIKVPTS